MSWLKDILFGTPQTPTPPTPLRQPLHNISGTDLAVFAGTECCPICSMYNHRIFSVSGTDNRFPALSSLPDALHDGMCDLCKKDYGLYSWYEGKSAPDVKTAIQISNAPLVDNRTMAQKRFFYSMQNNFKNINITQNTVRHKLPGRHNDLVIFFGSSCCPICSMYNRRVFSVSGRDKRFPHISSLPSAIHHGKCDLCGYGYSLSVYFETLTGLDLKTAIKRSNAPLVDTRTPEQKQYFYEEQNNPKKKKRKP